MANRVDLNEAVPYEPPRLDLLCLQIQQFLFLVLFLITCSVDETGEFFDG